MKCGWPHRQDSVAGGGVGSQNSPPLPLIVALSLPCPLTTPTKGSGGLFDCVCCIVQSGVDKDSPNSLFAVPPPPAGWSQCSLSVPSYDQLATAGQINTSHPLASVTPLRNSGFVPCGLCPNSPSRQICGAIVICGDEVLTDR